MIVEVWDEQGPLRYVELEHPLPPLITLPVKQRGAVLIPAGQRHTIITTNATNEPLHLLDQFQLFALHDHDAKMLTPVYVKLTQAGTPCPV